MIDRMPEPWETKRTAWRISCSTAEAQGTSIQAALSLVSYSAGTEAGRRATATREANGGPLAETTQLPASRPGSGGKVSEEGDRFLELEEAQLGGGGGGVALAGWARLS